MEDDKNYPLDTEVHLDEFEIRTPQKEEQGRAYSESEIRIVLAVEDREGKEGIK